MPQSSRVLLLLIVVLLAAGACAAETPLKYSAGWLGNSFANPQWIQKDGLGLAVGADGACYLTASWDEVGKGLGIYRDGNAVGMCQGISVGDGAVAVDDKYIYGGTYRDIAGKGTHGIGRWGLDGSPAPTAGGSNFLPIGAAWMAAATAYQGELFVGDTDAIRVYDRETLVEKRHFPCPHPFRLAVDHTGLLWVIGCVATTEAGMPATLTQYTRDGALTGVRIADVDGATALAITPTGGLLVAGPRQQVLKYDLSGQAPKLVGTLGVAGGVWAGTPGAMAPNKLLGLIGVGCDALGNIYTLGRAPAVGGGVDLRKFKADGTLIWQRFNTGFTDCADVDPASDGLDVYTRDEHFVFDAKKPLGAQWVWKGYTLDPRYDDGRAEGRACGDSMFNWGSPLVRRLQGRLYLFTRPGSYFGIFRQGKGEVFLPSGLIGLTPTWLIVAPADNRRDTVWPPQQPTPRSRWNWRDANGDGKIQPEEITNSPKLLTEVEAINGSWVDDQGDIWLAGSSSGIRCLWHMPLLGFDAQQNPIYTWEKTQRLPLPKEFTDCGRIQYDARTDTMYLSGMTPEHPNDTHWGDIGPVIARYDHWSKPERTLRWTIQEPAGPPKSANGDAFFPALAIAGNRVFVMQRYGARIWVYDADSGAYAGMVTTTPEVGPSGWCDMPFGLSAFARKDGSVLLLAEDDYRPKVRTYLVPPQPLDPKAVRPAAW